MRAKLSGLWFPGQLVGCYIRNHEMEQQMRMAFVFCFLVVVSMLMSPDCVHGDVTIKGRLYYWNQEPATSAELAGDPSLSGRYLPLRDSYLQVEFDATTQDIVLFSDQEGTFSATKRNPLVGKWKVNIEIRAQVQLGKSSGHVTQVSCFDAHTAVYPYNCQTASVEVGSDSTATIDVYLGGPQSNIDQYWNEEADTLAAFFSCQSIRYAYLAATLAGTTRTEDLTRPTVLIYPGDSAVHEYEPFTPPPGRAHIQVAKLSATSAAPEANSQEWLDHRNGLVHEFGHKMMHDIYWTIPTPLPNQLRFWKSFDSNHEPLSCINPELGFVEGWAEFFGGWAAGRPTLNGGSNYNLELAWHPVQEHSEEDAVFLPPPLVGKIGWRTRLSGDRRINELENAAVVWDLIDPRGEEFMPAEQQGLRPAEWPTPLKFTDSLEDPSLNLIWSILKDHNPDCLQDENDLWEDSLQYYWTKTFASDQARLHAFKVILFNRGITSTKQPEQPPVLQHVTTASQGSSIRLKVTEPDLEDRNELRYNVAIQTAPDRKFKVLNRLDAELRALGFRPGDSDTGEVDLPMPTNWYRAIVLLHDNMLPTFLSVDNPDYRPDTSPSGEHAGLFSLIGTWEAGPDAVDLGYWNGFVYLCQGPQGMQVIDLADPANPQSAKKLFDPAGPKSDRLTIQEAPVFRGPYAYIPTAAGLRVLDVAEMPGNVRDVTMTQSQTPPWALVSEGKSYFNSGVQQLANRDDFLFILSSTELYSRRTLSPPQSMDFFSAARFNRRALPGTVLPVGVYDFKDMAVAQNVLCGASLDGLAFFDFADPAVPHIESVLPLMGSARNARVKLKPPYAFVVGGDELTVVDYSDLEHPSIVWQEAGNYPLSLDIYERWLVVASTRKAGKTNSRLMLYDIQNPSAPQLVGEWLFGHNQTPGYHGYPTSVRLQYLYPWTSMQGTYALVSCDAQDAALMVFRLEPPASDEPK